MIYLLHFSQPISPDHTTQHYLGYCVSGGLERRLKAHRSGQGARLTQVAIERNITFTCVRIWQGTRTYERLLKRRKESPKLCPVCSGQDAWHRAPQMTGHPNDKVPF
jgi:predicted GIY-YIG superfamily endonuclease